MEVIGGGDVLILPLNLFIMLLNQHLRDASQIDLREVFIYLSVHPEEQALWSERDQ